MHQAPRAVEDRGVGILHQQRRRRIGRCRCCFAQLVGQLGQQGHVEFDRQRDIRAFFRRGHHLAGHRQVGADDDRLALGAQRFLAPGQQVFFALQHQADQRPVGRFELVARPVEAHHAQAGDGGKRQAVAVGVSAGVGGDGVE